MRIAVKNNNHSRPLLCDFHIHSNYSDGALSIPEIIDFYGQRKFNVIAITDHLCEEKTLLGKTAKYLNRTLYKDNFQAYLEEIKWEAERAWLKYKMVVIPGVEITKNSLSHKDSAHILGLGISKYIDPNQSIPDVCKSIRQNDGICIAAHPVSTKKWEFQTFHLWRNKEELKDCFDAWEVASGKHLFPEVLTSSLPKIANSDLHKPQQMSSWKTIVHAKPDVKSILQSIKKQKVSFEFYKDPLKNLASTLKTSKNKIAIKDSQALFWPI